MNSAAPKSRKSRRLVLIIVLILLILCVILVRKTSNRDVSQVSIAATTLSKLSTSISAISNALILPKQDTAEIGLARSASDSLQTSNAIASSTQQFQTIAVVDLDRLLTVYPPANDTQEARAEMIRKFERTIATCVAKHHFAIVVDRTGKSLGGSPFILNAEGAADLTEEVLKELNLLIQAQSR